MALLARNDAKIPMAESLTIIESAANEQNISMIPISLIILLASLALVSILWTHFRGAPWVPTFMGTVHKMLEMAEVGPGDLVYDLGCGDGRIIVTAARRYGARAVGVEIDPLRYLWCQILITLLNLRGRVKIVHGDFFKQDLSKADVITCYLLQHTNHKLEGGSSPKKLYQ